MAGPAGFVGREGELSQLLGALGGDVRLVLVVGDAGVGKTRFVTEAMDRAAAAGMVMVRGECLRPAGCWRRRWMPPRGTCGKRWGGCCRGWGRAAGRLRLAGTVSGAGSGCSP